jgi:LAO/AO transport system kinase
MQALKAGIMEIADIFVVNKADREGADRLVASIDAVLMLEDYGPDKWRPPIVRTQATTGSGIPEVLDAVERFRVHSGTERVSRRRGRNEFRLKELLASRFLDYVRRDVLVEGELDEMLDRMADRHLDPHTAASLVLARATGRRAL